MTESLSSDIYFFEDADSGEKKLLGGKGAGLARMTQLGLPVPSGFIITTKECSKYYANNMRLPPELVRDVGRAMKVLEEKAGKGFGDPKNPLLVSVRSGAAVSMPGMMDTVLNVGLNDQTVEGLIGQTGSPRFAYDAYRRFVQLFGKVVLGIKDENFPKSFDEASATAEELKEVVRRYKEVCRRETGEDFPEDPYEQLTRALAAVFKSWNSKRCVDYRREFKIGPEVADGTAVSIVAMVFGNMGGDSGTGVVFTRDPATGEKALYGEYLINAQGEDVVAGIRTPSPLHQMEKEVPEIYRELIDLADKLERHYQYPQDIEFTIERGNLYLLQTRDAKMNAAAKVRVVVEMVKEGILREEEAVMKITPENLEQMLHRRIDPDVKAEVVGRGIGASPGAASGVAVFDADTAERRGRGGERVILVREETKPEDVHGFFAAQGILTSRGGKTSHAAVVARGIGKACVVGCAAMKIDLGSRQFTVGRYVVKEGDWITIDGTVGELYVGDLPTVEPEPTPEVSELLSWADKFRRLGVRANADTFEGAAVARRLGAEGIGLCRTERMFNAADRLPLMVGMILADSEEERGRYLAELVPLMREDFMAILKAMEGYPVTIRLLDPPLHEFLPNIEELQEDLRRMREAGYTGREVEEKSSIIEKARGLAEVNPMLGHRGVRVGVTYPDIYESQVRAICEATAELLREGLDVKPQIMVPQVALREELEAVKRIVEEVTGMVEGEYGVKLSIKYGTMIEVVRACVTADEIAEIAEFFSFGTNDLTQATFSFSREDAENKFLPIYEEKGVLNQNPFQTIDSKGVGELMKIGVAKGRRTRPELEIGICGEHGGDPASIALCHEIGLTYVSCSPYRIPIARLASAQAALMRPVEEVEP